MVQFGETALMVASFHGWYSVVRRLVDAGANLEAKNRVKRTALMLAASEGHTNVVATLLRAGSDLDSMEPGVGLPQAERWAARVCTVHARFLHGCTGRSR
mgnify:CR=1 FL=1